MITLEQVKTLINGLKQIIPPFSKPNWDENDESRPHYIRNRPFYKKCGKVAKRIGEEYLPQSIPQSYKSEVLREAKAQVEDELNSSYGMLGLTTLYNPGSISVANSPSSRVCDIADSRLPDERDDNISINKYFLYPSDDELGPFPGGDWANFSSAEFWLEMACCSSASSRDILFKPTQPISLRKSANGVNWYASSWTGSIINLNTGVTLVDKITMSQVPLLAMVGDPSIRIDNRSFEKRGICLCGLTWNNLTVYPHRLYCKASNGTFLFKHLTYEQALDNPIPINLGRRYETMAPGGIISASPGINLNTRAGGWSGVASSGKIKFLVDGHILCTLIKAIHKQSTSDPSIIASGWQIWIEGQSEVVEEGRKYIVSLSGQFYNSNQYFYFKLDSYSKEEIPYPHVPSYSQSEDEGKTLKIVNGVPTWV